MCGASGTQNLQKEQVRVSGTPRKRVSGTNRMEPKMREGVPTKSRLQEGYIPPQQI